MNQDKSLAALQEILEIDEMDIGKNPVGSNMANVGIKDVTKNK